MGDDKEPQTPKAIAHEFTTWTSAHGVPHIGSASSLPLKIFWSVIFLTCLCLFSWQMSLLVEKYTDYDVTVFTQVKFEERVFPAVTICGLNAFRKEPVEEADNTVILKKLLNEYDEWVRGEANDNNWGFKDIEDVIQVQTMAQEHIVFIGQGMTEQERLDFSYSLNEENDYEKSLIVNCAFNTAPCRTRLTDDNNGDFTLSYNPNFGNCYTFNYQGEHKSTRSGPLYGLRLLALANQDTYLPFSGTAGLRISVHSPAEDAYADAFGFNAAAGFTTSLGLKYIRTVRLPPPHGSCAEDTSDLPFFYDGTFNVEGCFRSCYQEKVIEACGCGDGRYHMANGTDAVYCAALPVGEGSDRDCLKKYSKGDDEGEQSLIEQCECPLPCEESLYGVTISTAIWPSEVYIPPECEYDWAPVHQPWMLSANESLSEEVTARCKEWFSHNTLLLEVYYDRMNYQSMEEVEAYSLISLISDMGGQLGLWMGVSVITMMEFISLLVLICRAVCCKKK